MQFRLLELLVVFTVAGFACAALVKADLLFESLFFSFTLLTILGALAVAIGAHGGVRACWLSFVVAAGGYLFFAHSHDIEGSTPRHYGPEITTRLLRWAFNEIHDGELDMSLSPGGGGFFSVDDEPTTKTRTSSNNGVRQPLSSNLSIVWGGGQEIVGYPDETSRAFMRIGHSAWALLLGWLSAHVACFTHRRLAARS